MTRSLNVTPKTTLRSGKSEAKVTITIVIILLRLTTDRHKALRSLSGTAELLVKDSNNSNYAPTSYTQCGLQRGIMFPFCPSHSHYPTVCPVPLVIFTCQKLKCKNSNYVYQWDCFRHLVNNFISRERVTWNRSRFWYTAKFSYAKLN